MKQFQARGARGVFRNETTAAWLLSLPALALLLVFLVLPFFMALGLSLTDQRLIPNPNLPTSFLGLGNYARLLTDGTFHRGLANNLYFSAVVVPVQTGLALGLALLIHRRVRGINVFRTIFFSPVVITMVVVSIVWYLLFNPGQGLVNKLLAVLSLGAAPEIAWLHDVHWALPAIMIVSIWQGVGFQMIIFLAGLQEIPAELYEASHVDGATRPMQFFKITLPMLRNTLLFVVISTSILSFKLFQQVWVMTQGGPQDSTMTTIVYLYRTGFRQLRVGYSSAIGVFFFLVVFVIAMIQRRALRSQQ